MDRIERERTFQNAVISDDLRRVTEKYYSVTTASRALYVSTLERLAVGHDALEIGCSQGDQAIELARHGARVCGADVSTVALDQARRAAERAGLSVDFRLANAEAMPFPNGKFDLVYGCGILHHLDLERVAGEIARVLKPNGSAVFYEPLGHNPFINLYRRLTPSLRSEDEHPLLVSDLEFIARSFRSTEIRYFHACSLASVPFRNTPLFRPALRLLESLDDGLFRTMPYLRRFAWMVVMVMHGPIKPLDDGKGGPMRAASTAKEPAVVAP